MSSECLSWARTMSGIACLTVPTSRLTLRFSRNSRRIAWKERRARRRRAEAKARQPQKNSEADLKALTLLLFVAIAGVWSLATTSSRAEQQPTVAGLWQALDSKTKKPVSWFLFADRGG